MSLENVHSASCSENCDVSQQTRELSIPFLEEGDFVDCWKIVGAFSISSQFSCDFPSYKFTTKQFEKLRDYKELWLNINGYNIIPLSSTSLSNEEVMKLISLQKYGVEVHSREEILQYIAFQKITQEVAHYIVHTLCL